MIKQGKLSLSLLNTIFLVVFLIIIVVGIFISVFYSSKRVLDYNINEYAKQTKNITNVIIKTEQKELNNIAIEIADLLKTKTKENYEQIKTLNAVDQVDLFFIKTKDLTEDYSQSLFDTQMIIKKLDEMSISQENTILSLDTKDGVYILFLSIKTIIEQDTGRVSSRLFLGKILNDNFPILNEIKQNSLLKDIYIYYKDELIGTTSNTSLLNKEILSSKKVVKDDNILYFKRLMNTYNNGNFTIVYETTNSTNNLLKSDFEKIAWILAIFVVISFVILYMTSNKFIIKPFSNLLEFANRVKDNKDEKYESSYIKEFDEFALKLKEVIDELRELKEQYSRAINGVEDGLWDYDLKTKKLFLSHQFMSMLGFEDKEAIKNLQFWKKSIHKEDYFKTMRKLINHKNGHNNIYEDDYRFLCADGSYKHMRIRGKIFYNDKKKAVKVTGVHTDIDALIKLQNDNVKKEQLLFQQNKLASMGEMIGNIAHQWRQPLNVISTIASSQLIGYELDNVDKKSNVDGLNKLIDTVNYLSSIIERFRDFFNPNKESEEFYIDDMLKENIHIFEASYIENSIELVINVQNYKVVGYKFELMQVILNIINNAKDALILNNIEDKFVFIENSIEGDILIFKIYDNAGGVKDSIKNKIYEPYFTTKHQSQGTGLGLYMSREIIRKHFQGELINETIEYEYKGAKYKGEEFTIKVPKIIEKLDS